MKSRTALSELLDANAAFSLAGKGTTNHCPMALIALSRMGASDQRLRDFFMMWKQEFSIPAPSLVEINTQNYLQQVGKIESFSGLRSYFEYWISISGASAVFAEVFDKLPIAPASGAFHALIRLAYGLEAGHCGEIASGLAACVLGNLPIPIIPVAKVESVQQGLRALSEAMCGGKFSGNSIQSRLRAVVADERFIRAVPSLSVSCQALEEMAIAAIRLYLQTKNFTVLHLVTGMHAARILYPYLSRRLQSKFLFELWLAFCAAYASVSAPAMTSSELSDFVEVADFVISENWNVVFETAVNSQDDHIIKMVYSCYQENLRTPSPHYFQAAIAMLR